MDRGSDLEGDADQRGGAPVRPTVPSGLRQVGFSRIGEITRVDFSRLAVPSAVSGGIGYAVPLIVGVATGRIADGIAASAGALIVAFADIGGRYPLRAVTLLSATFAVGAAAVLGGLAATSTVATAAVIGAWGFGGGLAAVFGMRAAFVGLLSTWALLLAGDLHLHGKAIFVEAGLMVAGGLVETAAALAAWPFRVRVTERRGLAAAYRALAVYARHPDTDHLAVSAAALSTARATIGTWRASNSALLASVKRAEWIRLELAALAQSKTTGSQTTLVLAADALDAIAAGHDPQASVAPLVARDTFVEPGSLDRGTRLAQLIVASERDQMTVRREYRRLRSGLDDLRAELDLASPSFRHALRLSAALVVGVVLYRGLSLGLGYWVPLTVLFMLKADYGATVTRITARAAGTVVGVSLAWLFVRLATPTATETAVLLAALAGAALALYSANYAASSVLLTVLIALVVEFGGGSPVGALADRLTDSAVGIAIALVAITAWPTRESPQAVRCLVDYVETEALWVDGLLLACEGLGPEPDASQLAARRARVTAVEAVGRALLEPSRRRPDGRAFAAVLVAMDDVSAVALAVAAAVSEGSVTPAGSVDTARRELAMAFHRIVEQLNEGGSADAEPAASRDGVRVFTHETAGIVHVLGQVERSLVRVPRVAGP